VQTSTRSKHRLTMISEYTTYHPPTNVGMKMVRGPWFFATFAGGWNFRELEPGRTEATWRYTFSCRPRFLNPITERIGSWLLGRDIERRLQGFAAGCRDADLLAAVASTQS
jgi:ribosome-associated toxin RatA of RatAB toxin-antitoxin module